MIWFILIVMATLFIAYANGANNNFKGVATLFGSGTTDYRKADGKVISGIAGAWVLTLPVAAILSVGSYFMLSRIGS